MGNTNVFRNNSSNFVEQLKIDLKSQTKILGVYINPNEFPTSGLIVVSSKSILSYNPIYGSLNTSYTFKKNVLLTDYNRKSKEGSLLSIITDDMKCYFISTENLTVNRTINILTISNLKISDNSKISCINFHLNDALLIGCSDGSVIKCKLNDEPVNLLYEIKGNKFTTPEDEFASIKNVYSSDTDNPTELIEDDSYNDNYSMSFNYNIKNRYIQDMLISSKFKVLFCINKINNGYSNVSLFNLRTNSFMYIFCKVKGNIRCSAIDERNEQLLIINFNFESKKTILEFWKFSDSSFPITTYDISSLLDYPFTITSLSFTKIPFIFYGRNSIHGKLKGDVLILGSSKGDIIIGNICNIREMNNKIGFEHLMTYKLQNNNEKENEDISSKFEISYIAYDLNFDLVYFGDVSSNCRFIEKVLQIGKKENVDYNLPFFSFDDDDIIYKKLSDENCDFFPKLNYDLPIISINHDVIKDRSIILYDKGKKFDIKKYNNSTNSIYINEEVNKENNSDEDIPSDFEDLDCDLQIDKTKTNKMEIKY
jgi:hypothetical protein